ncbi:hypothetical protein BsWGS_27834 [Bradybaena similaris]
MSAVLNVKIASSNFYEACQYHRLNLEMREKC